MPAQKTSVPRLRKKLRDEKPFRKTVTRALFVVLVLVSVLLLRRGAQGAVIFSDDFNRADSPTMGNAVVGGTWAETDSDPSAEAKISANRLKFDAVDDGNQPHVQNTFVAQSSGTIEWIYDFDWTRTGPELTYELWMQLGNNVAMGNVVTSDNTGVAVNLKWAGTNRGMTTDEGFGYVNPVVGTTQVQVVSGPATIKVTVDLDANTFNLDIGNDGTDEATGVAFDDASVVSIDAIRIYTDNVNQSNFSDGAIPNNRTFDNITINTVVFNTAPTITSVTDSGSVLEGSPVTFDVYWLDPDSPAEQVRAHLCKSVNFTVATETCVDGEWEVSPFSGTSPITLIHTTVAAEVATSPNDYVAFVCDDEGACSGASSLATFTVNSAAPPGGSGTILREWWTGIGGTAITDLTSNSNYPNNPTGSDEPTSFEAPTNWADGYGTRMRGYIHPPTTGDYTFWIASDDNGELWLSTDDTPGNKSLIANVPDWTTSQQWTKFAQQQSTPITLTGGQQYYIEALQKEGGGGDNLAVAWQGPGITQQVIPGAYLSPWVVSGLVAHWELDETAPAITASDSSGSGNTGMLQGNPIWVPARINNGLDFDGVNDYVQAADSSSLQVSGDLTIAAWIYPRNLGLGRQGIVFKDYNHEYEVIMEPSGDISFYHGDGMWEEIAEPAGMIVPQDQWSYVTITRSMSDSKIRFYKNGSFVGEDVFVKIPVTSTNPLVIASRSGSPYYFDGIIDDVRIYDRVLLAGEINTLFIAGMGIPTAVTFQQGDGKGFVSDTDDAEFRSTNPTSNYGTAPSVNIDDASPHAHAALKFPNIFGSGPDQIPLGSTINNADLTLNVINSTSGNPDVWQLTESWVEAQVTWDDRVTGTAWVNSGADGTGSHKGTAEGAFPMTAIGVFTMPVTTSVQNWANGEINEGWVFTDNPTGGADFDSSENATFANRPKLTVDFTPPANISPTVSITVPADGATFIAPANIVIDATANDTDGTVSKVEFFEGVTKLGEDTTGPLYSFTWNSVAVGSYVLTAVATDNGGATTTSAAVNITVDPLPTLSVTLIANPAFGTDPLDATLTATVTGTATGPINYSFWWDCTHPGTSVSDVTNGIGGPACGDPFLIANGEKYDSMSLPTQATNSHTYTLAGSPYTGKVIAERGAALPATNTATVTVNLNDPPTVSITSPPNNATFISPADITIAATASDTSPGTVSQVEFFQGATSLGVVTTTPYSVTWNSVAVGSYVLTAVATDNGGATTTSTVVNIIVSATAPDVITKVATSVDRIDVTLEGSVDPNDADATVWFRWRDTDPVITACNISDDVDAWGTRVPASAGSDQIFSGDTVQAFSETMIPPTTDTTYYYCAFANNSAGAVAGEVKSFFVPASLPPVITNIPDALPDPADVAPRVYSYGDTYNDTLDVDFSVEGEATLNEVPPGSGVYEASGFIDSETLDTRSFTGAGFNSLLWDGVKPDTGLAGGFVLQNFAFNSNAGLIGTNCNLDPLFPTPGDPDNDCTTIPSDDWKVEIDALTGIYSGWAWSDTIGWFSFNCSTDPACDPASSDYFVVEPVAAYPRRVTGWTWSFNEGFIAMSCDSPGLVGLCGANWDANTDGINDGVWVDDTGAYHGWGWSDNIGWVSFDCDNTAVAPYNCGSNSYQVTRAAVGGAAQVRLWLATSDCPNAETDPDKCVTSGSWTFRGGTTCAVYPNDAYEPEPGVPSGIPPACYSEHWNNRYFRYRVQLCSFNDCFMSGSLTPTVRDMTVNWSP